MMHEITFFQSLRNAQGKRIKIDLDAFINAPRVCILKSELPLFSFAHFRDDYRDAAHFEEISMLGFDVDVAPVPTEQAIISAISGIGCSAFYHTTSSASADNLRWRLFIPLGRSVSLDEYRTLHAIIRSRLPFPVGTQATDATRAWFVPSKSPGKVFVSGSCVGNPIDVDKWLTRKLEIIKSDRVSADPNTVSLPPSPETHSRLVQFLASVWPPIGKRDDTHMALAGTLARLGYGPDWVGQLISDLSAATGSDKGSTRASMVRRTFEKMQTDSPVKSHKALAENIGLINVDQINDILGLRLPRVPVKKEALVKLPPRNLDHKYSYSLGDAPASELKSATMSDIVSMLSDHPDWKYSLRFDKISDTIVAVNPPLKLEAEDYKYSNNDVTNIRMWLESRGIKCTNEACSQAIEAAAKKIMWNPIADYLAACPQKPGAILALASGAMGLSDPLSQSMIRKQLIAAVRRALAPNGVKVDSVVVFKSLQGKNKTQFIEELFGKQYVKTNLSDIRSKDAVQELRGIWAVEFGELASIANADVESLKEFLSRSIDKYRPSYGKYKIDVPRTCVFFGTTNSPSFLKDETGNRRFWVIELPGKIDLEYVHNHRDEIWGEAYAAAQSGENHWLIDSEEAEAEQRAQEFVTSDAWQELVFDFCKGKKAVRVEEVYQMAICGGDINAPKSLGEREARRLQKILTMMGARLQAVRLEGRVVRAWKIPDVIRETSNVEHIDKPSKSTSLQDILKRVRKS